jgi:hypothetical protein
VRIWAAGPRWSFTWGREVGSRSRKMLFWADLLYTPAMIAKRRRNDAELAVEATAEGNSGELMQ